MTRQRILRRCQAPHPDPAKAALGKECHEVLDAGQKKYCKGVACSRRARNSRRRADEGNRLRTRLGVNRLRTYKRAAKQLQAELRNVGEAASAFKPLSQAAIKSAFESVFQSHDVAAFFRTIINTIPVSRHVGLALDKESRVTAPVWEARFTKWWQERDLRMFACALKVGHRHSDRKLLAARLRVGLSRFLERLEHGDRREFLDWISGNR